MNEKVIVATADFSLKRIWRKFMITLSCSAFLHNKLRIRLLKWGGGILWEKCL